MYSFDNFRLSNILHSYFPYLQLRWNYAVSKNLHLTLAHTAPHDALCSAVVSQKWNVGVRSSTVAVSVILTEIANRNVNEITRCYKTNIRLSIYTCSLPPWIRLFFGFFRSFVLSFILISSIFLCLFLFFVSISYLFLNPFRYFILVAHNDATDQIMKCLCDCEVALAYSYVRQYVSFYYVVCYNWISMNMKTNASRYHANVPLFARLSAVVGNVCFCANVNIPTDVQYIIIEKCGYGLPQPLLLQLLTLDVTMRFSTFIISQCTFACVTFVCAFIAIQCLRFH